MYIPIKAAMIANLDSCNDSSCGRKFVVAWYAPFWGMDRYVLNGAYTQLNSGAIGASFFGRDNRAVTICTPQFAASGVIDSGTWDILAAVFLGNALVR
jgi:hypothetical protein